MSFLLALTLTQAKAHSELSLLGEPHVPGRVWGQTRSHEGQPEAAHPLDPGSLIQTQSPSQAPAGLPAGIHAEWA